MLRLFSLKHESLSPVLGCLEGEAVDWVNPLESDDLSGYREEEDVVFYTIGSSVRSLVCTFTLLGVSVEIWLIFEY